MTTNIKKIEKKLHEYETALATIESEGTNWKVLLFSYGSLESIRAYIKNIKEQLNGLEGHN